MCATSATNVAQNVAQFYLYFKYKSVYVHENSDTDRSGEEDDLTKIFALKKSTTFLKVSWFIDPLKIWMKRNICNFIYDL